ncbi:BatD family protein [Polaribacter sp.]|nr:BatD family protein [Polaribacter sp.]MDB4209785.1 BatD family protein [Polaribacter sp.]MDC1353729.1 BatD family protein [Polaribacter sp.]
MKLKIYISIFVSILSIALGAQEAKLTTTVSKNKLGLNQRLRVEFSINKQGGDNFTPPQFQNFRIVGGPSQSISQSYFNGKSSYKQSYSYIVQPTKKGILIIPAASIDVDGKKIKSAPVKVRVLDPVDIPKDPNDPNYIAQQNIHLVAEISNARPYVGQGVYVEYRLYISNNINVYDAGIIQAPKYNGFWSQEIKINGLSAKKGTYNGEPYKYFTLQKSLLIPTKSGKLSLDPMKMEVAIGVPTGRGDFFGNPITKNIRKEFASAKKIINSKELPLDGKPLNFTGAVGDYSFSVDTDKQVLKANESSQIKVTVKGKGNLKLFELPEVVVPKELEIYAPERKERVRILSSGISGTISDLYTVVPQFKGKYKVPNISFSYFNPTQKKYKTITTEDLIVNVLEGKELVSAAANPVQKQALKITGKNFRYIQTKTTFTTGKQNDFFKSNSFYLLLLLSFIAIPSGIFIAKKQEERNSDLIGNKLRRAERLAKKYLSEAAKQLGKKEAFYESLERALHNYLKAKLGIETLEISKEKITQILQDKKVSEVAIKHFMEVLEDCDFARYAPSTTLEMKEEYEKAKEIIIELDKQF